MGFVLLAVAVLSQDAESPLFTDADCTPLVKVKVSPREYNGRQIIVIGGTRTSELYTGYYSTDRKRRSHQSLQFREFADPDTPGTELAWLYVSRSNAAILDAFTAFEAKEKAKMKLVRARVTMHMEKRDAKQWNVFELNDVQFASDDLQSWGPWIEEQAGKEAAEAATQARLLKEAEEQKIMEAERRKEEERLAKLPKPREWVINGGKNRLIATYQSAILNKARLQTENGKLLSIDVETLSDADKEYLKSRNATPVKVISVEKLATGDIEFVVRGGPTNAEYVRRLITSLPDVSASTPKVQSGSTGLQKFFARGTVENPFTVERAADALEKDPWIESPKTPD